MKPLSSRSRENSVARPSANSSARKSSESQVDEDDFPVCLVERPMGKPVVVDAKDRLKLPQLRDFTYNQKTLGEQIRVSNFIKRNMVKEKLHSIQEADQLSEPYEPIKV